MGLVSPSQSNAGDLITAAAINSPVNQLAAVVNGNIDSTNILDSSVSTPKIALNAVTGDKLATGAIFLGYAEITGNFTKSTIAEEDVPGLSVTVTVPAGGRRVKITFSGSYLVTGGTTNAGSFYIKEGANYLAMTRVNMPAGEATGLPPVMAIELATAGIHTYKLSWALDNTQPIAINAGPKSTTAGNKPVFMLVELI